MNKTLIRLLRQAHSIEIGAYHAYEGHWRSIKPINSEIRGKIKWIQVDELLHKETVYEMLQQLGAQPNYFTDFILFLIGKSISISCHFMGYRTAMWGAKLMEKLGSQVYENLIAQAIIDDQGHLIGKFIDMANQEKKHEEFFKTCLRPSKESDLQSQSSSCK